MHASTFQYLKPTDFQMSEMQVLRDATRSYADVLERTLPDGADKTYTLCKLRELAMWANVAITRFADGAPREPAQFTD